MTILKLFEKVNLVTPMEQRLFFNYFEDTVNELEILYPGFVFEDATEYLPPETLSNEKDSVGFLSKKPVGELYHNSVVDNILFLAGQGENYKSEFIRKSHEAYLEYWNRKAKGRNIKRGDW